MKRLRRWLFRLATILSALLGLVWLYAWAPYALFDCELPPFDGNPWAPPTSSAHFAINPMKHGLRLAHARPTAAGEVQQYHHGFVENFLGFWVEHFWPGWGVWTIVVVPTWFALLVSGAFPGWWMWRRYRASLAPPPGHCTICGYDLRASPQRCPECGTART